MLLYMPTNIVFSNALYFCLQPTIARLDPKFVALHCQEVGGKNYEKSMRYVEDFVKLLVDSDELRLFDKARIYLDEDYSSAENFTALGNFYFIHESITDALIYDFEQRRFVEVEGKVVYSKDLENIGTKEKSKFPLEYFPEFPSIYSDTRRRALAYTLERFQTDEYGPVSLFLFGDFNFRTDTQGVVKHLSEGLNSECGEDEVSVIKFKEKDKVILSLGKKVFSHSDHQTLFTSKDGDWLREFDKELEAFSDQLFEFEILFPPSYPFEENSSGDRSYMKTRCPAWCDRVIMSHSAIPLVKDSSEPGSVVYSIMGRNTCMGDHKLFVPTAKSKWPDVNGSSSSRPDEKMANGVVSSPNSEGKHNAEKNFVGKMKYGEIEVEKLACSLEALMSQNSNMSAEREPNIEPDLSRCASCRMHQSTGRVVNNPGGEEISMDSSMFEDKKLLALLAREIKVPDDYLQKIEIQDTGQREEKETCNWECKSNDENLEKFGVVKRVNSASLVEHPPKKEDWKNTRCNSDVAWSPSAYVQSQALAKSWKSSKQFNRGSSRIRLISSSNSLNASLPRLTSHHSSSDEEWFEEVEEGDDDVLRMNDRNNDPEPEPEVETETETETVMDIYPEFCGDKGAVTKTVKPATESISRTNLFVGKKPLKTHVLGKVPSDTNSCVEMVRDVDDNRPEIVSLTGKSLDGATILGDGKTRQAKHAYKSNFQTAKEPRSSLKLSKSRPLNILKRLAEGRKESQVQEAQNRDLASSTNRESFETLIVDPTVSVSDIESAYECPTTKEPEADETLAKNQMGDMNSEKIEGQDASAVAEGSWETIELGSRKTKDGEKTDALKKMAYRCKERNKRAKCADDDGGTNCCCILQ
ncbi:hypothetical protein RUM44_002234 [Polyplax serrata]|uniref:inositol-polyphosphate 5-phosphatase n=1 Tax=Polyplax serrata TaxID=468196 RepID=A0ABR1AMA4_POLSC